MPNYHQFLQKHLIYLAFIWVSLSFTPNIINIRQLQKLKNKTNSEKKNFESKLLKFKRQMHDFETRKWLLQFTGAIIFRQTKFEVAIEDPTLRNLSTTQNYLNFLFSQEK